MQDIKKYCKIFVLSAIVGFISLLLVSFIPNRMIETHAMEGMAVKPKEHYVNAFVFTDASSRLDTVTENLMLDTAVMDESMDVIQRAMDMDDYARYWHGYITVLRPLLVITDLNGIYMINMLVFYVLFAWLLYTVAVKIKPVYSLGLLVSFIPAHFYVIPCCLQYINVFLIAFIACLILLRQKKEIDPGLVFFFAGICTAYFDFLTAPLITLILPLEIFVLMKRDQKNIMKLLLRLVIIWGLGYGAMWASKWIIGSLILHRNVLLDAVESVGTRTGLAGSRSRIYTLETMIVTYFGTSHVFMIVLAVIEILSFGYCIRHGQKSAWGIIAIQLIVATWYFVVANHSSLHSFMAYRNMIAVGYGIFILVVMAFDLYTRDIQN